MKSKADRILKNALELPGKQRARLVAEILASLEPAVPESNRADAVWIAEIERRARAALAGAPGVPWAEARRKIENRLTGR